MEKGIVRETKGSVAYVEFQESGSCSTCGAKALCNPSGGGRRQVMARNTALASVGDKVGVAEAEHALLKVSTLQYGVPLAGFLIGTFSAYGSGLTPSGFPLELFYAGSGLMGLLAGGMLSWLWAKKIASSGNLAFEITRIL